MQTIDYFGNVTICRYDLNNRMQESKLSKNGLDEITQFTYDNNGNMYSSSKSIAQSEAVGGVGASLGIVGEYTDSALGETAFYTFNELNQLTGYTNLKGIQASYTYDANGLRNSKTVNGTRTDFYTEGGNVINESVNGAASASNLFAPAYMSRNEGENTSYYLFDGHGDVTQLTNGSGSVTKDYTYDIWGNEDSADDNDTNPFRYCGEYYDNESGNIYLRARYYNPDSGRFISEDPIGDGLNWYAYCSNNPIMFVDPSGYMNQGYDEDGVWHDYDLEEFGDGAIYAELENITEEYNNAETDAAREKAHKKAELLRGLARQYFKNGNENTSSNQKKVVKGFKNVIKYESTIKAYAESFGIDAGVLATVVFRETIMTDAGDLKDFPAAYLGLDNVSVGLCQIQPRTARGAYDNWLSSLRGEPTSSEEGGLTHQQLVKNLNDPIQSIRYAGIVIWDYINTQGITTHAGIFTAYTGHPVSGQNAANYVPYMQKYFN